MTWRSTPQSGVDRMVSTGWNAGRRSSPVARQGRAIARGPEGRPAFQQHHIPRSKQTKTASPASFSLDLDHGIYRDDTHYMCVPKGLSDEKLAVVLDLMNHLLTKEQQAYTYDEGYFYPGPAVKGVTLDMAPEESRDAIKEFGRPEYEQLIASAPLEAPLDPAAMVQAFRRWDEEIGGAKRQ